ncbi:hypothetical protein [Methylobacterium sp. A54F]
MRTHEDFPPWTRKRVQRYLDRGAGPYVVRSIAKPGRKSRAAAPDAETADAQPASTQSLAPDWFQGSNVILLRRPSA